MPNADSASESSHSRLTQHEGIIRGTVTYPRGTVSGATVALGKRSVTSDNAGRYEISGLAPGVYDITAQAPFPGYVISTQKVEVAGETKTVDIYLDFEKAIVEGHVYDQDGKPIREAVLSGALSGSEIGTATTDERGYFKFDKVTPGDRHIRVKAQGYMSEMRDFTAEKGETSTLELRLTRAKCRVYGNVTDEKGQPLQAEMSLLGESGVIVERTLSDAKTGFYEFSLLPGTWVIIPSIEMRETKGWQGSVSADARIDFSFPPRDSQGREAAYSIRGPDR